MLCLILPWAFFLRELLVRLVVTCGVGRITTTSPSSLSEASDQAIMGKDEESCHGDDGGASRASNSLNSALESKPVSAQTVLVEMDSSC